MQAHGALQRGISVLMIDGPGQGGTLRRHKIPTGPTTKCRSASASTICVTRNDVDPARIAVCGSSLGGYYAARAGCYEHRLAAAISHGAIWSIHDCGRARTKIIGLADAHQMGVRRPDDERGDGEGQAFHARGPSRPHEMPLSHRAWRSRRARRRSGPEGRTITRKSKGVDVTLRFVTEDETGAEHCQHDNPTIGQELMADWLADRVRNRPARTAQEGDEPTDLKSDK